MKHLSIEPLLADLPPVPEGWDKMLRVCPQASDDVIILGQVPEDLRRLICFIGESRLQFQQIVLSETVARLDSLGHDARIEPELAAKWELRARLLEILDKLFWMELREHFVAQGVLARPTEICQGYMAISKGNSDEETVDFTPMIEGRVAVSQTGRLLL